METNPTVDDLLRRWQSLKEQNKSATVEDLCADDAKKSAELREHLRAVASMMSFLGLEAESSSTGPVSTDSPLPDGPVPDGRRRALGARR